MVIVTSATMKPSISIHNAPGSLTRNIQWEGEPIVGMGWTYEEDLLVVTKTGEVSPS